MFEKTLEARRFGQSPTVKAIIVGVLVGLLLPPLGMVMALIDERESYRAEAVREVGEKWGMEQIIGGPVLLVPYLTRRQDAAGEVQLVKARATLLPTAVEIDGELSPELRYRGIFEVPLYTVAVSVNGTFTLSEMSDVSIPDGDFLWSEAVLSMGIPDPRGIRQSVTLQWDGTELGFEPGSGTGAVFASGMHVPLGEAVGDTTGTHTFRFDLALNGSRHLAFVPVGRDTRVRLISSWPSPSFTGAFLPDRREVSADGFSADWRMFYLGRSYPQRFLAGEVDGSTLLASAAGVDLLLPVDEYSKSMRSAKYGILFLLVTFGAYYLFEILGRRRIHPFQYLLVGASLVLFYLLLVSLSEHIGFDPAYAVAAVATVSVILVYSGFVLGFTRRLTAMGALLTGLYLYLYTLLQLEDVALLLGTLGLFAALATVMWVTRRVDWYALTEELSGRATP